MAHLSDRHKVCIHSVKIKEGRIIDTATFPTAQNLQLNSFLDYPLAFRLPHTNPFNCMLQLNWDVYIAIHDGG